MRRICIFLDGTWQSASQQNNDRRFSNVYELSHMLDDHDHQGNDQIVIYSSGIGSDKNRFPVFEGLTARGLQQQISETYVNLLANYRPQDTIHLFGYSRGAIAARLITYIVSQFGILKPEYADKFHEIWAYMIKRGERPALENKHSYRSPRIAFLGLFDSVIGTIWPTFVALRGIAIPKGDESPDDGGIDLHLEECVDKALHILAMDEWRRRFRPTLWTHCHGGQEMKQVWLPGTHADVGGQSLNSWVGLLSRLIMLKCAEKSGLAFDKEKVAQLDSRMSVKEHEVSITKSHPIWYLAGWHRRRPYADCDYQCVERISQDIHEKRIQVNSRRKQYFINPKFSHLAGTTTVESASYRLD